MADAHQGNAGGACAEGGEHGVQPGHPLRQQDELPAAATGHQQEPAAEKLRSRGRGERQQQLRHEQVHTALQRYYHSSKQWIRCMCKNNEWSSPVI